MATKSGDKKWHLNLVKVGKVVSTSHTLLLSDYSYYTRLTKCPRFYT